VSYFNVLDYNDFWNDRRVMETVSWAGRTTSLLTLYSWTTIRSTGITISELTPVHKQRRPLTGI